MKMSYPEALRHLSKKYIQKPECKQMLEEVARSIEDTEYEISTLVETIDNLMYEGK